MPTIKIKVDSKSLDGIDKLSDEYRNGLIKGLQMAAFFAEGEAKKSFGTNGHLSIGTGALRRSIMSGLVNGGSSYTSWIGSDSVYAGIHEFGGKISAKNSPWLIFKYKNKWVKKKSVDIPARPYLQPAFEDNLTKIEEIILDAIYKEVK